MSEKLNRDFSRYEAMTTEELEEILRLDAEAPEGAGSDTELILYILEVLASRKNAKNITGNTAQAAWESFQQNYMPEEPQKSVEPKEADCRRGCCGATDFHSDYHQRAYPGRSLGHFRPVGKGDVFLCQW